jgi:hypothetical protein
LLRRQAALIPAVFCFPTCDFRKSFRPRWIFIACEFHRNPLIIGRKYEAAALVCDAATSELPMYYAVCHACRPPISDLTL